MHVYRTLIAPKIREDTERQPQEMKKSGKRFSFHVSMIIYSDFFPLNSFAISYWVLRSACGVSHKHYIFTTCNTRRFHGGYATTFRKYIYLYLIQTRVCIINVRLPASSLDAGYLHLILPARNSMITFGLYYRHRTHHPRDALDLQWNTIMWPHWHRQRLRKESLCVCERVRETVDWMKWEEHTKKSREFWSFIDEDDGKAEVKKHLLSFKKKMVHVAFVLHVCLYVLYICVGVYCVKTIIWLLAQPHQHTLPLHRSFNDLFIHIYLDTSIYLCLLHLYYMK